MGIATLYGIANCDTVKKARAWLEAKGIEYRFHDYKVSGVERTRLNRWCGEVGWEALLNRAGTTFRKSAVALMLAQPSVIKRPVVELRERVIVGFKPELYGSLPW